jgi:hypothetical protein
MPDIALPAAEHPEEYQLEGYRTESEGDAVESRPFHIVSLIAVLLIGLSLVALGAFAVFRLLQTEALPELRAAVAVAPMVTARRRLRAGSNRVS